MSQHLIITRYSEETNGLSIPKRRLLRADKGFLLIFKIGALQLPISFQNSFIYEKSVIFQVKFKTW